MLNSPSTMKQSRCLGCAGTATPSRSSSSPTSALIVAYVTAALAAAPGSVPMIAFARTSSSLSVASFFIVVVVVAVMDVLTTISWIKGLVIHYCLYWLGAGARLVVIVDCTPEEALQPFLAASFCQVRILILLLSLVTPPAGTTVQQSFMCSTSSFFFPITQTKSLPTLNTAIMYLSPLNWPGRYL